MNDLSMHIIDIIQNSVSAGATRVDLTVDENVEADRLTIEIADNGRGMTAGQVSRLEDPLFTTRTTRKVGMGIPLLIQSARQSGGDVAIVSEPGAGTTVTATFGYSNIDRPPLGDAVNAFMLMVYSNPGMDFSLLYRYNGKEYLFDTSDVREIFGDGAMGSIPVVKNLERMVKDNVAEIRNS